LKLLGERQIIIDCDVIQADGGTRTASITGGWVALACAINRLLHSNKLKTNPIISQICAVSCGIWKGFPILDLDYSEDSTAEVDSNFVFTLDGKLVEIQASSEADPFERTEMDILLDLALGATKGLFEKQMKAVNET
jgi:ribonuclease PH